MTSPVSRASVEQALEEAGFDPRARAETLSLEDYLGLAGRIDAGSPASAAK